MPRQPVHESAESEAVHAANAASSCPVAALIPRADALTEEERRLDEALSRSYDENETERYDRVSAELKEIEKAISQLRAISIEGAALQLAIATSLADSMLDSQDLAECGELAERCKHLITSALVTLIARQHLEPGAMMSRFVTGSVLEEALRMSNLEVVNKHADPIIEAIDAHQFAADSLAELEKRSDVDGRARASARAAEIAAFNAVCALQPMGPDDVRTLTGWLHRQFTRWDRFSDSSQERRVDQLINSLGRIAEVRW